MQNNIHDNQQNGDSPTPFVSFEKAWANLKPELDKEAERRKKKRRFIIFWFFLFAIGLGLGTGWYFMNNNIQNSPAIASVKTTNNVSVNRNKEENNNHSKEGNTNTKITESNPKSESTTEHKLTSKVDTPNNDNNNNSGSNNNIRINKSTATTDHTTKENVSIAKENISALNSSIKPSLKSKVKSLINKTITKSKSIKVKDTYKATNKETSTMVKTSTVISSKPFINNKPIAGIDNSTDKTKTTSETNIISDKSSTETIDSNTVSTDSTNKTIAINTSRKIDNTKHNSDTTIKSIAKKNDTKNKPSILKGISYGVQFNIPFGDGVNHNDINGNNQPLSLLIPTVWISKQFGKRHSVSIQLNPYSSFYVNNNAVLESNNYNIKINHGTRISNGPETINYNDKTAFNKIFSVEATLLYNYQLAPALKLGIGISNNWVQGALIENKVTRNYTTVTKDSLYGIDNKSKEWSSLKSSFILGKMELQYQIKKIAIGLDISTPLGKLFIDKINTETLINKNIFIKWTIK